MAFALGIGTAAPAAAQGAGPLREVHGRLQPKLAASAFGRPLLIDSSASADDPHGDVYAVVEHAFGTVAGVLAMPGQWCELLMLQINVKRCALAGSPQQQTVSVGVGRKFDQPVEDTFPLEFSYSARVTAGDHLAVDLAAARGPFGTRDYRLRLEAVPIDARRTFIRLTYAYASGLAARMATDAYLATAGRNKVGFTVIGTDRAGRSLYVGGVRGIAERNVMRYFLAIDTLLDSQRLPAAERRETRWRSWFAATERHSRQLHEMTLDEYLATKRQAAAIGP